MMHKRQGETWSVPLLFCLVVLNVADRAVGGTGQIVYPWRSTTAIVEAGECFDVWFDADAGQTVSSVQLQSAYKTVSVDKRVACGNWVYDQMSGNEYNTRITVTVPPATPADRYNLLLKTSAGDAVSYGAVKVVADCKAEYYIMHISDGHLYQNGHNTDVLLARKSAMIDIADIMDVQILIETGDNMYNVRNHPERESHYFLGNPVIGTKGMAQASAATFLAAGDHDAFIANDWPQATAQQNAEFFNRYWGRQNYCFRYGNGRFMLFNNAWDVSAVSAKGHQYQVDEAIAWLQGDGSGGTFFVSAGHCYDRMHKLVNDFQPLDIVLAGDRHHVRTKNPWSFAASSPKIAYIAGSIREHFEFNLYKVNNRAGTFSTPPGPTAAANVLSCGSPGEPSTWVPNLQLTYTRPNDGEWSTNSAEIVNRYYFPIEGARVRFVMPGGTAYAVSPGSVSQQFEGKQFRIVDVNLNVNANSSVAVNIMPAENCPDETGRMKASNL